MTKKILKTLYTMTPLKDRTAAYIDGEAIVGVKDGILEYRGGLNAARVFMKTDMADGMYAVSRSGVARRRIFDPRMWSLPDRAQGTVIAKHDLKDGYNLLKKIDKVIGKESERPILSGLHVIMLEGGGLMLEGTNGKVVVRRTFPPNNEERKIKSEATVNIVNVMKLLKAICEKDITVSIEEVEGVGPDPWSKVRYVKIKAGDASIFVDEMGGKYPDIDFCLDVSNPVKIDIPRQELIDYLKKCMNEWLKETKKEKGVHSVHKTVSEIPRVVFRYEDGQVKVRLLCNNTKSYPLSPNIGVILPETTSGVLSVPEDNYITDADVNLCMTLQSPIDAPDLFVVDPRTLLKSLEAEDCKVVAMHMTPGSNRPHIYICPADKRIPVQPELKERLKIKLSTSRDQELAFKWATTNEEVEEIERQEHGINGSITNPNFLRALCPKKIYLAKEVSEVVAVLDEYARHYSKGKDPEYSKKYRLEMRVAGCIKLMSLGRRNPERLLPAYQGNKSVKCSVADTGSFG